MSFIDNLDPFDHIRVIALDQAVALATAVINAKTHGSLVTTDTILIQADVFEMFIRGEGKNG
jgi:hypothetical protein